MAALRWRDFDLERGRVNLDVNKSDHPRDWDLRPVDQRPDRAQVPRDDREVPAQGSDVEPGGAGALV
jgi:hypothetical protein